MNRERINYLQKNLEKGEGMLITSYANRLYYTGFPSSAGIIAISADEACLFIDFRYYEKAKATVKCCKTVLQKNIYAQINDFFKRNGTTCVFLETDSVDIDYYKKLEKTIETAKISTDSKMAQFILKQRSVKSEEEISLINQAQILTDKTFSYICGRIEEGRTEREIMLDMDFFIRKNGSEGVSFDFIVVSGKNSSLPHGVPTDKKVGKGDFITLDFGAVVKGYRSDMTRTVALGCVSEKQKEVYGTVLKAQTETLKMIKAGIKCADVDKTARDIISNAGYGEYFGHSLGHSVGLEIHENPVCSPSSADVLSVGNIMTVEPGIYIENAFGVRIEDMVAVTENGCTNFTKSPKNLIVL